jgi:hypothetical protein
MGGEPWCEVDAEIRIRGLDASRVSPAYCRVRRYLARNETNSASTSNVYRPLQLFGEVLERVRADHVEKPDSKLIEAAINGMLMSLDPHSYYGYPYNGFSRPWSKLRLVRSAISILGCCRSPQPIFTDWVFPHPGWHSSRLDDGSLRRDIPCKARVAAAECLELRADSRERGTDVAV